MKILKDQEIYNLVVQEDVNLYFWEYLKNKRNVGYTFSLKDIRFLKENYDSYVEKAFRKMDESEPLNSAFNECMLVWKEKKKRNKMNKCSNCKEQINSLINIVYTEKKYLV